MTHISSVAKVTIPVFFTDHTHQNICELGFFCFRSHRFLDLWCVSVCSNFILTFSLFLFLMGKTVFSFNSGGILPFILKQYSSEYIFDKKLITNTRLLCYVLCCFFLLYWDIFLSICWILQKKNFMTDIKHMLPCLFLKICTTQSQKMCQFHRNACLLIYYVMHASKKYCLGPNSHNRNSKVVAWKACC